MLTATSTIANIFEVSVSNTSFLLEEGKGLRIEFNQAVDIEPFINGKNPKKQKVLYDLVENHGFLVLKNALTSVTPNAKTSGSLNDTENLTQDPFHRDFKKYTYHNVLYQPENIPREAPTYYAMSDDVRQAIQALLATREFSRDVTYALKKMAKNNYSFSIAGEDLRIRQILERNYPEFTDDVFSLIPETKRYKHEWNGKKEVIIHSNDDSSDNYLLHARPASDVRGPNTVKAFIFFRSPSDLSMQQKHRKGQARHPKEPWWDCATLKNIRGIFEPALP